MIFWLIAVPFLLMLFHIVFSVGRVRRKVFRVHENSDKIKTIEPGTLYYHINHLSQTIGCRSIFQPGQLLETQRYIITFLENLGVQPQRQSYNYKGEEVANIIITQPGSTNPDEVIIVGAHYDTVANTPGADDNASGVAILLELCRSLKTFQPERTLKFIFFTLEEPPAFKTRNMGSMVYAAKAKEDQEKIMGMICLEMVGFYDNNPGTQTYPLPLMSLAYPRQGNFIGLVSNLKSKPLLYQVKKSLGDNCDLPVESLSTIRWVPGIDFSDHGSFWKMGFPAIMITDTSFYRNPHYHSPTDTIDTLDFNNMNKLLSGLMHAVKDLCLVRQTKEIP
jgi:Zn-dependent M28 family amino/carboxypeptidase